MEAGRKQPLLWSVVATSAITMLQAQQVLQKRYQLVRQLGNNAGRQTWLAKDLAQQPPRPVIVKLLAFVDPITWKTIDLFDREAKIPRQLNHPRIPRYLNSFSIDDRILWFGLVQEFIPGVSLKDLLEQGTQFSEEKVCQLTAEVLQILIYLHKLNPPVFHRDIKPSNLIWGKDRHIHLIDFGAVQDKAAKSGATFTVVGTYGYAPMEQFGGRTVPSSDLYALGATLIHLLTGVAPADLPQEALRIQFADRANIRPGLIRWIEKLAEPDSAHRFSTAEQALEALQWIMQVDRSSLASRGDSTSGKMAIPYQRPELSRVELHRSPEVLQIRIPGDRVWQWIGCIAKLLLFASWPILFLAIYLNLLPALSEQWAIPIAIYFSLYLLFVGGVAITGDSEGTSLILKLTRDRCTLYREIWHIGKVKHQRVVHEISTPEIQKVFRLNNLAIVQASSQEIRISGTCRGLLARSECDWLVQEIERWLGL